MENKVAQEVKYEPSGPTVARFHSDPDFVRGLMGPIGSSKSTACVMEILTRAMEQEKAPDGIRYTRWAIIRNSYPELKSTTIKTWAQWCPTTMGRLNYDSPITHHIKTEELDMEVLFLALDRDEDVRKLLSLELTGAWVNEAREVPKAIVDALTGRVGRYPPVNRGGCTWSGIMMDTNPPDDQSWWYTLAENKTDGWPEGWKFYRQPSGRSAEAENLQNLPKNYYKRIMAGKDQDWINVYVDGNYGFVTEGKAVFSMYRDSTHCAQEIIEPVPGLALFVGVDFGIASAAVIGQKLVDGRWLLLDEFVDEKGEGVIRFAEQLTKYVATAYPDHVVACGFGDPAGDQASQLDKQTALAIMREYTGWKWKPAPTNELAMRLEVVKAALNRLVDGNPGYLVSPKCKLIRKGFAGGYHYKPIKTGNGTQYHDTPNKNQYSHPHDANQYLLLGGGEHQVVLNKVKRSSTQNKSRVPKDTDFDVITS